MFIFYLSFFRGVQYLHLATWMARFPLNLPPPHLLVDSAYIHKSLSFSAVGSSSC